MPIILDVETISTKYPYICDIAWGIIYRNQLKETKNYIPTEHLPFMAEGEFSKPKMAITMQEVANGRAIIRPYKEIMQELKEDVQEEKYLYAYNASFDRRAIIQTCKVLTPEFTEFFENPETFDKWRCLWAWTANTIIYKKSFINFCDIAGLRTPKGFCSTSAETVLKFLYRDINYEESHTALKDIEDEFQIYLAIKQEVKRDYQSILIEEEEKSFFVGKPFYTIKKLENAIEQ